MEVTRDRATDMATAALCTHDIPEDDANLVSEVLVTANVIEKPSHGLLRLPRIVRGIEHENVDPNGVIRISSARGSAAAIDGGSRLGPVVACEAMAEAMNRADEYGIGAVGVHNSNHLGMLGYYTEMARREGYVAIGMTNTEPAMPPYGSADAILGTNPIAIGFPTDPPFNLDMSTSSIARGSILHAEETDERLPEGVALDDAGEPTTDPAEALDGVILPFGGVKGAGLAVAVEVLAGGLVGASMGEAVTGTYNTEEPCSKGDMFVAVDPDAFVEGFTERANEFLHRLKSAETAADFEDIRLPGERSALLDRTRDTIEIDEGTWTSVQELAAR